MTLRHCILCLLLFFPDGALAGRGPPEGSAAEALRSARAAYRELKSDAGRRKFRHHWLNVAEKFEQLSAKFPKSSLAAEALFTSGELLAELSRFSALPGDLDAAVADFQRVIDGYPRHALADDAALCLARIAINRRDDVPAARRVLQRVIQGYPRGNRIGEARALLASLPAEPVKKSLKAAFSRAGSKPSALPALARMQETLRGVRVGGSVEDKVAKARVRQFAKDEQGAELTLAHQLGLKVRRVVIDAGHGGHDSGAVGHRGTREKDVALAIARKVAERLSEAGLEVLLTRNDDTFVRLEDRARFANDSRGDLFISIHCNAAAGSKLRGIETYTLNTSADRYSIRLAARENTSSERRLSDLQFILADLATKANTEESTRLAGKVQQALVRGLRVKHSDVRDLGTKEALFYVLLGTRMPAVLVETSFLSNREEELRLASPAYQSEVAASIAAGVREFLGERERLAKVD